MPRPWHTHRLAHETVRKNPWFFCDECLDLGVSFSTEMARQRKAEFIAILKRAGRRARRDQKPERAKAVRHVASTLSACTPLRRCGKLPCPECARAFQCARAIAHIRFAAQQQVEHPDQKLVFVTIIPDRFCFAPDDLAKLNVTKANRWFKDRLRQADIRCPVVGSIDISWEDSAYQIHWHIGMMTSDRRALNERLTVTFHSHEGRIKPAVVKAAYSHGFIHYSHKLIEAEDILRRARRTVPDLFLALHRTEPLSTMILLNLRLSTLDSELVLRPTKR